MGSSVEVFHIATKALRRGGSLQQARAYFQIIPVGSTHPRLLAVGGQGAFSTLDTSEWWEEEEDSWEEGPALSRGRSNFAAILTPPHLVCSEIDPPAHSCPAAQNTGQTCLFPTGEPGEGAQVCEIEGNEFSCPTANASINAPCDRERCPLQGPPMAPIMESQLITGQVVVGGLTGPPFSFSLSSVELFPRPPSDSCSIPPLPQDRSGHSLSLLSGGRLVVCGGESYGDCISWVAGNTSWTHFHTMSVARFYHTAWTLTSLPDSIVLLGDFDSAESLTAETVPGGGFELKHSGDRACGIPEAGDTINLDWWISSPQLCDTVRCQRVCRGAPPTAGE